MAFAVSPPAAINPWLQILSALEKKVIRQSFETWLKPTRFSHATGRTLYVRVPSAEFQHIGDKYGDLIQEAIDLQALEFFIRDEDRYGKTAAYRANGANVTFYDRAHGLMGWLQLPKDVAVLPVPWRADLASLTTGDESA